MPYPGSKSTPWWSDEQPQRHGATRQPNPLLTSLDGAIGHCTGVYWVIT